ncbi:zinc finger, CCHC-type containing protein, partial [Tanacetum coccineum]
AIFCIKRICDSSHIKKVLKKFSYFDCTPVSTPMDTSEKLMHNNGQTVSQLEYSRVIGWLMYAMTCTRSDIAFVMGKLSRYTSNPGTQHWQAIQRVLKYLKKTMDYRLTYTGYPLVLEGYTDTSWISNTEDNSSTSGWVFLLAISWASKKQTCITGLIMKSEFVALTTAGKEAEWFKNLLFEIPLWSKPITPIYIRCDSATTLAKAYSQMYTGKSRRLGVKHSMIRELITNGVISIVFMRSQLRIPSGSNPSEEVSSTGLTHQQVIDGLQPDTGSQQPTSNSYETRRELWYSLEMHKKVCEHEIVGINISMRAFNDYINKIEIADVNSTGLHCTWNQKPKGETGILKKIDRLMYNIDFNNEYPVGYGALENEGLGLQHVQASEKDKGLFVRRLSTDKAANMVHCVSDDEIQSAMFSIGNDKVPGPNGYTSVFFKKSCDVVGMDVCNAVKDFFSTGLYVRYSDDEEYAMVVMDFKKFFRRRGKFVRQQHDDKKSFRRAKEENKGKEERRCFKCGNPNHFISECPKHSFNDQKAFVGGCWSDSEEEDASKKDEICLMALDNNEKRLERLEKNKEISVECESCIDLHTKINSISLKLAKFENSSHFLQEMIENQRLQKDKKKASGKLDTPYPMEVDTPYQFIDQNSVL